MIENNVQPFEGRSVNGRILREIGGPRKGSYSSRPKGNSAGISCLRMPTRGRQTRPRFRPNCSPAKALHFRSTHSPLPPYDFSIIIPDRPLFRSKAPPASFPRLRLLRFSGFRTRILSKINETGRLLRIGLLSKVERGKNVCIYP